MAAALKEVLIKTLGKLKKAKFKRFKTKLEGDGQISKADLEEADIDDTVEQMVDVYSMNAGDTMVKILEKMKLNQFAIELKEDLGKELGEKKTTSLPCESNTAQDETDHGTAHHQTLRLENCTIGKLEEFVSDPKKAEELVDELKNKVKDGEMEKIENDLRKVKGMKKTFTLCFHAADIVDIKKNKELKDYLKPGKEKIFPSIAFKHLFETSDKKQKGETDESKGLEPSQCENSDNPGQILTENTASLVLDCHDSEAGREGDKRGRDSMDEVKGMDDALSTLKTNHWSSEHQKSACGTPSTIPKQTCAEMSVHEKTESAQQFEETQNVVNLATKSNPDTESHQVMAETLSLEQSQGNNLEKNMDDSAKNYSYVNSDVSDCGVSENMNIQSIIDKSDMLYSTKNHSLIQQVGVGTNVIEKIGVDNLVSSQPSAAPEPKDQDTSVDSASSTNSVSSIHTFPTHSHSGPVQNSLSVSKKSDSELGDKDYLANSGHEVSSAIGGSLIIGRDSFGGKKEKSEHVSLLKRDSFSSDNEQEVSGTPSKISKQTCTQMSVHENTELGKLTDSSHMEQRVCLDQTMHSSDPDSKSTSAGSTKQDLKDGKEKQKPKMRRKQNRSENELRSEQLHEWAKGQKYTLQQLSTITVINKMEHKTIPCLVADYCITFQPPTGDRQVIFFADKKMLTGTGKLKSDCEVKLQYEMGILGINKTIVLLPDNCPKPVQADGKIFEEIVELCRRFVFEVLAPLIVVFKKIQKEELVSKF